MSAGTTEVGAAPRSGWEGSAAVECEGPQRSTLIPGPLSPAEPVHSWRGLMLDSARTCWDVEVVHELLDLMSRYRLNRLHWHLTDDSGWRFAVPGYERLSEVGARLPRPNYGGYDNVLPAKRELAARLSQSRDLHGQYTADEIAGVVDHARRLGIEIMPEVDLPGHMAAAIRSYPELGDPRLRDVDPAQWNHPNDLLWPSDASFDFLTAVLRTVMDLFPFSAVHLGGDECKYWIWESDPDLVARFGDGGEPAGTLRPLPAGVAPMSLSQSGPGSGSSGLGPRLQTHFTDHARSVLAERSRRPAAWDELLGSSTTGDELIVAWRHGAGASSALESGNDWIYADCAHLYLNRVADDPETEPPGMFGTITPRGIIELEIPESPTLRGIQAAVWTEFILDREHLHHQLFPRLLAVAERAWCGADVEWEEFAPRLEAETAWLRTQGVLPATEPRPS
ncbi:hypothetical protein CFK38_16755 [Brachybacterium vulturis]|uniref:beta-N-acetylhexosaminidase n=2 Tax=Brachybacterium vulturis TaxID=2017484 RepID=A0A291GSW6_9MICO|nr:family 20 glycosylhydrolase [Brachybacterium vulturis]ATG53327.1 hypothetical protein CFK38_16755 [Brachybacterium vulturis]